MVKLRKVDFQSGIGDDGLSGRFDSWQRGIRKISFSPVFGSGIANATNLQSNKLGLTGTVKGFYAPHNEYINILLVTGALGLFLYLLLFMTVYKKANIVLKNNANDFSIFIAKSIKAIIIALAIFNIAVGFWDNAYIPSLLMLMFGAMYTAENKPNGLLNHTRIK